MIRISDNTRGKGIRSGSEIYLLLSFLAKYIKADELIEQEFYYGESKIDNSDKNNQNLELPDNVIDHENEFDWNSNKIGNPIETIKSFFASQEKIETDGSEAVTKYGDWMYNGNWRQKFFYAIVDGKLLVIQRKSDLLFDETIALIFRLYPDADAIKAKLIPGIFPCHASDTYLELAYESGKQVSKYNFERIAQDDLERIDQAVASDTTVATDKIISPTSIEALKMRIPAGRVYDEGGKGSKSPRKRNRRQ